ncbi:hypothetical protein GCM10020367_13910 [Streptomyces sannanensis]|uniref:N-acetyltransferase domain-containing protein n=1 Tax=Streptomyces sannanensis TaxID=285536 RepID=A0ABP6S7C5_9ACTN
MIRHATVRDLDAIAALHAAARATYYRRRVPEAAEPAGTCEGWARAIDRDRTEGAVLCAELDGLVVGAASYRLRAGQASLTQLHVHPAHWSRGVGTALHTACVTAWQRAGVRTARLGVYEHNVRARAFYARHGWRPDPGIPRLGTHLALRLTVPDPPGA